MHYYKKNIGDYHKKAGRLSMLQHGAYTLLMDACYDREQFPTLDEAIDWTWASTTDEIEAVKFVLQKFFKADETGRYYQDRIKEELERYHATSETNKRIAREREANRKKKSTKRVRNVNEAPPNHKPITNNHKPIDKESPAYAVALKLSEKIKTISSNNKPNLDGWAKDIDKAIRLDNRTPEQLMNCIEWIYSPGGKFWQSNILSGKKLRDHFEKMSIQAKQAGVNRNSFKGTDYQAQADQAGFSSEIPMVNSGE